eukprot:scaffold55147_cov37-Tisochrysis_lutea.AAC.1
MLKAKGCCFWRLSLIVIVSLFPFAICEEETCLAYTEIISLLHTIALWSLGSQRWEEEGEIGSSKSPTSANFSTLGNQQLLPLLQASTAHIGAGFLACKRHNATHIVHRSQPTNGNPSWGSPALTFAPQSLRAVSQAQQLLTPPCPSQGGSGSTWREHGTRAHMPAPQPPPSGHERRRRTHSPVPCTDRRQPPAGARIPLSVQRRASSRSAPQTERKASCEALSPCGRR